MIVLNEATLWVVTESNIIQIGSCRVWNVDAVQTNKKRKTFKNPTKENSYSKKFIEINEICAFPADRPTPKIVHWTIS
jgi:hypothetical protein